MNICRWCIDYLSRQCFFNISNPRHLRASCSTETPAARSCTFSKCNIYFGWLQNEKRVTPPRAPAPPWEPIDRRKKKPNSFIFKLKNITAVCSHHSYHYFLLRFLMFLKNFPAALGAAATRCSESRCEGMWGRRSAAMLVGGQFTLNSSSSGGGGLF